MRTGDWATARTLVTGARSFIGSNLCQALVDHGAAVHGVSKTPNHVVHDRMRWSDVELANASQVRELIQRLRPDFVFHLAGRVTGAQLLSEVEATLAMNLVTTVNVMTAAADIQGCRVVLAGSMEEPDNLEGTPTPPSPYAASKWACSAYARMFHNLFGLDVVIARPMMVYGPGQWDLKKLLPYVIVSLLRGTRPQLSNGLRPIDWVYIDDVIEGLMAVASRAPAGGRPIDLGTGCLTTVRHVLEHVTPLIPSAVPLVFGELPDRPFEQPRAAQVEETARLVGWKAGVSLAAGLHRTVDWYRRWVSETGTGTGTGSENAGPRR